jgi:hypothetical protein
MYNNYDDLNFDEELHLSEEEIRRRHNQRSFLRRNAQLLQQELELQEQLLEENPELAQAIHDFNNLESQTGYQGLKTTFEGETETKKVNVWSKFFPGLGY